MSAVGASPDESAGQSVDSDGSGGAFFTGLFEGTTSFGGTTPTSSGYTDIFVAHVNSTGVIDWAVRAGGSG